MSKFKVKVGGKGADEMTSILFGLYVYRKSGSTMEVEVEAPDAESAKEVIRSALGPAGRNLLLEAEKV